MRALCNTRSATGEKSTEAMGMATTVDEAGTTTVAVATAAGGLDCEDGGAKGCFVLVVDAVFGG